MSLDPGSDQGCHTPGEEKRFQLPEALCSLGVSGRVGSGGWVADGPLTAVLDITQPCRMGALGAWRTRTGSSAQPQPRATFSLAAIYPRYRGCERPSWLRAKTLNPAPSATLAMLPCLRGWQRARVIYNR